MYMNNGNSGEASISNKVFRTDILLVLFLIVGIVLGAVASLKIGSEALAGIYSSDIYTDFDSWMETFLNYFAGSAVFVTAAFLMGFGAVSHPFEIMLVCFKGLGLGVLVSSIYSCDDILIRMALFLPFAVLSSGILIMQSCESVAMSQRYFSLSLTNENRLGLANEFRDYILKFLIYLVSCGVLSALNCLVLRLFDLMGWI